MGKERGMQLGAGGLESSIEDSPAWGSGPARLTSLLSATGWGV